MVLVTLLGLGLAFALGRARGGNDLGHVLYVTKTAAFLRDLDSGEQRRLVRLPRDTLAASADPDGEWIAYTRRRGDLWIVNVRTGQRRQLSEQLTAALGWTPEGRLVAHEVLADHELVALDPSKGPPELLLRGFPGGRIVWIDERRFLWSGRGDLIAVEVGEPPKLRKLVDSAAIVAVAPDHREILYVSNPDSSKPRLVVAPLDGGSLGKAKLVFRGLVAQAGVSEQGYVAFSGRDRRDRDGTWVLRGLGRTPVRISKRAAEHMAWTKDGASMIFLVDGSVVAHDFRTRSTVELTPPTAGVIAFEVVP